LEHAVPGAFSQATRPAIVVGTGRMAPGVAAALAYADVDVAITGREDGRARVAAHRATVLGGGAIRSVPFEHSQFAHAHLVVECIAEDLAVKRDVLGTIDQWLPDDAILTTNTSSLPITQLASGLNAGRFAGLHFLHPAEATALVELVPGEQTSHETMAKLSGLVERMGKRPVLLHRDIPGFIWNRLQFALLRECLHLLEEDVADLDSIDIAVSDGLAPRWLAGGPFMTADLGGRELFRGVADQLFPQLSTSEHVSSAMGEGDSFYPWTEDARAGIESLRAHALRVARRVSRARQRCGPGRLPSGESAARP
jgi:3-hydroxybutyryl-CoA dehydrogenase